jgi:cytochrome c peroxidase
MKYFALVISIILLALGLSSTKSEKTPKNKEELGKLLFFDPILSSDKTISCASCHKPELAFADNVAFSNGVNNKKTARNTPSAMNMLSRDKFFWDGRANTLAEQALGPIENPDEMNLPIPEAIARLKNHAKYNAYFLKIFGKEVTPELLGEAIAAFEETLETGDSDFDKFVNQEKVVFSESAQRGRTLFNNKGKCFDCHFGPDFTGDEFKNIGLYNAKELNDVGRFGVTKDSVDLGAFKVPGLRNVAITAPYMHNGMFNTLREVIDYYDNPAKFVKGSINTDTLVGAPLGLTEQEKIDIEAFMLSLTDKQFKKKK